MKKKIVKPILIGILISLFCFSCTDLEENLYSEVTPETFLVNDESFASALGEAYTRIYGIGGNGNLFPLQEVSSDEMVVPTRNRDWDDGGLWRRIHRHEYNTEDGTINGGWRLCFGGVSTCNRLLDEFSTLEVEGLDTFVAELKVLRALYYYWLLDLYGNVPIVTSFAEVEATPSTKSRQEVFGFVESELLENIDLVTEQVGGEAYGRANRWTAHALLAKLYLNAEVYTGTPRWEDAITQCDAIISSGAFNLAGTYFEMFAEDNIGSPETIFAVPYDEVFARGFVMPMMTLHPGNRETYNLQGQPWNGFCTLQEFYESYEDGDLRKEEFFVAGPQFTRDGERVIDQAAEAIDPDGPPLTFTPEISSLPNALRQEGVRIGKWEYGDGAQAHINNDLAIFRYSDVLLMKAEAQLRIGQAADALVLVNQIRARANVAPLSSLDLDEMLAERGRELFSEFTRRTDLIRFGKYNDPWWEKPASDPTRNIFPIPRQQLDANPNLVQNPGY
ncbi:MAG: RagB/SusD family nutrient uptake outer membrane protein [Bacteroidota bacterium]